MISKYKKHRNDAVLTMRIAEFSGLNQADNISTASNDCNVGDAWLLHLGPDASRRLGPHQAAWTELHPRRAPRIA